MHGLLSALLAVLALPPISWHPFGALWLIPWIAGARFGGANATLNGMILGGSFAAYCLWGISGTYPIIFTGCVTATGAVFAVSGIALSWRSTRGAVGAIGAVARACLVLVAGLALLRWLGIPCSLGLVVSGSSSLTLPAQTLGLPGLDILLFAGQACIAQLLIHSLGTPPSLRFRYSFPIVVVLGLVIMTFVLSIYYQQRPAAHSVQSIYVAQTSIEPWQNEFRSADGVLEGIQRQRRSLRATAIKEGADLIVWPESSVPGYFTGSDGWRRTGISIAVPEVTHGYQWRGPGEVSSVTRRLAPAANGRSTVAPKRHPVPIAERGITASTGPIELHHVAGLAIGTLICYEATIPAAASRLARAGADLIVNVTNDAYLGPSALPLMHVNAAALTALSSGVPMLRVANGGPSLLLMPDGSRHVLLPLYGHGVARVQIPLEWRRPGSSLSKWLQWGTIGVVLLPAIAVRRRRAPARTQCTLKADALLSAIAVAAIVPAILVAQSSLFLKWWRIASRESGATDAVELTYRSVTSADEPTRGAYAMLAREFGAARTASDVPENASARRAWLANLGLAISSTRASQPLLRKGVAYGYVGSHDSSRLLKITATRGSVVFNPASGRFENINAKLGAWMELNPVHWVTLSE